MGNYKELSVFRKSYEVAKRVYLRVRDYPADEQYGITSQMKRAATSIPLNIAEGYGKGASESEMLRFLKMAKGSVAEMEVLLNFSYDFGYISLKENEELQEQYAEIGRMLSGLMRKLKERITNA